ncbi:response regulator [Pedobacter kyungheensis]|uniref:response regulator n=1 Tax=Pedobacter kyungheensis TaxID=1069985 RepID=UPI000690015D|nr:response regulator [Pedobacter kyungheensis]
MKIKKILAVDDSPEILELFSFFFPPMEYQLKVLLSAQNIQMEIGSFSPDIILLDIRIGTEDGRKICNQLKANPATASIPIIMLSALIGYYSPAESCDADAFIAKPFDIDKLSTRIKTLTGQT